MSSTTRELPVITDDSGYQVSERDLAFLRIAVPDVVEWAIGTRPLGFSAVTYQAFHERLWNALGLDGVEWTAVDVRLKGSATAFFSGRHKEMPRSRDDLVAMFRVLRGRFPEVFEVVEIENRLDEGWPDGVRPRRRPFDSMHRVGLDRVPSDYDLQLSSDVAVSRCEELAVRLGIAVTREVTIHNVYDFVRKDLVRSAMPNLTRFAVDMSDALQRDVSLAVFPSAGPPDRSEDLGELSAHFRDSDWLLVPPTLNQDPSRD